MSNWQKCIVSYIDMIGIKGMLSTSSKQAVDLLRRMHQEVQATVSQIKMHDEICFWNDSVLLVGCLNGHLDEHRKIMHEVCIIKKAVDKVKRSYAICVKGQPFPPPHDQSNIAQIKPRCIYLHASSLAFSNCFKIEEEAKNERWRRDWYIDDRIIKKIDARQPDKNHILHLWPRHRKCNLQMYTGTFWNSGRVHGDAQQRAFSRRKKLRG